ncbi:MAG TPA: adenylate/guanylate cyclase domain-containing protein, partial [Candidatus Binataceae bacterium]|nr:adenylate/guanylate cyclase domain-containing protein [Candidatus Binataceae bacterium]
HPLKVRIGAAAGEPVEREHDLFGATVQLAARLCSHAQPEQILVSNVVPELCLGKALPTWERSS